MTYKWHARFIDEEDLKGENGNERTAWKKRKAGEYNESEIQREKSNELLREIEEKQKDISK